MKRRHHTPEQIVRKIAEGDKIGLVTQSWVTDAAQP